MFICVDSFLRAAVCGTSLWRCSVILKRDLYSSKRVIHYSVHDQYNVLLRANDERHPRLLQNARLFSHTHTLTHPHCLPLSFSPSLPLTFPASLPFSLSIYRPFIRCLSLSALHSHKVWGFLIRSWRLGVEVGAGSFKKARLSYNGLRCVHVCVCIWRVCVCGCG